MLSVGIHGKEVGGAVHVIRYAMPGVVEKDLDVAVIDFADILEVTDGGEEGAESSIFIQADVVVRYAKGFLAVGGESIGIVEGIGDCSYALVVFVADDDGKSIGALRIGYWNVEVEAVVCHHRCRWGRLL